MGSTWVPHNEYLLVKGDCHINVEFIGSFTTIKYVYKYVHKGVDVSTFGIQEINEKDEVTRFINARTIDPYDAHWRMSEYRVQERFPAVQKLAIHTEGQHQVIFKEGHALQALEGVKDTTLMAYFKLNEEDQEARKHKYQDIPHGVEINGVKGNHSLKMVTFPEQLVGLTMFPLSSESVLPETFIEPYQGCNQF